MRRQRFQAYGMQVMNNPILGEGSHKFSWYKFSHLEDQPKKVEVIILVGVEKLSVAPAILPKPLLGNVFNCHEFRIL